MNYSGLNDFAYSEIKRRLMENKILPKERIREDLLAEELKISRTPVREAINRLVAEGLVTSVPRKGLFAKEITNHDIEEMIEVRVALESLSISQCCACITTEQLAALEDIFKHYKHSLCGGDYVEASRLDAEIHTYIAEISNNERLIYYIKDLQQRFAYARARNVKWTTEMIERSVELHRTLLEAINKKSVPLAKIAIEADIRGMRSLLD